MEPTFDATWPGASALATECVLNVYVLAQMIETRSVQWIQERGIPSLSAFNVMTILDGAGEPLQPSEISARMMVTRGTMTGLLSSLERRGMIRRSAHAADGRAHLVTLTPAARRLVAEMMPRIHRAEKRLAGAINPERQRELIAALAELQGAAGELSF
jgi:DNA-binding MarR family transcriptional regulator